ncbi:serine hydrolase domain-containing protein [Actinoplanes oblitus]|uniref:Serine hydrolase domain-containing protein n=1 Tax=Actinoplanes oblitus TaxID=3040509 RepID=A0ABY8W9C8_9ACTN|nr:serine hydrolase domain-containing protein [Actinoplanes oblitus]WIM94479.1 serine hydrolase domain-containing protein [Actinoplanes oblitus]
MDSNSVRGVDRRRLLRWGGLAAAGVASAGVSLAGTSFAGTRERVARAPGASPDPDRIPPATLPGGAYDRYLAGLAAQGKFSGVVLLAHRGRTVLSRAYGLADREREIPNSEATAFNLSSAGKPFSAVAVLQLAQQGRLHLTDPVGRHLTGFPKDVAERVTIHHLLTGTSGLYLGAQDRDRVFRSRREVHDYYERRARQARLRGIPGAPSTVHAEPDALLPALIVQAVTGKTYWDHVEENIFRRCGMTGAGFYTTAQWLTDPRLAHPYMTVTGGATVDAVRHLDQGSPSPYALGVNPGRVFIDAPGDGGFASARDLARFAGALTGGKLLNRPWTDVLLAARTPLGPVTFGAYGIVMDIVDGQWVYQRSGGNPGVGANWSVYPQTGWTGVILSNAEGVPLQDIIARETQAVTGAAPMAGAGG